MAALACLLASALCRDAHAERKGQADPTPVRPTVAAARAATPVDIDGRLDEPAWLAAGVAADFLQRDPVEGEQASERTEVRVLFDDQAVYIGARMFDGNPGAIARRLTRRDQDSDDLADAIHVSFDPHHDHLTGAAFSVTAAGTQSDAVLFNDSGWDGTWDAVWASAVTIDERGWTAELRIPFSQLRFEAGDDMTWGFQVVRDVQRKAEESMWSLVGRKESGRVSRMGHLTGLTARGSRYLQVLPYTTLRGERVGTVSEGDPFAQAASMAAGLGADVKWGVTSSLALDATINPDFGQVEVDPAVVNLSAFETFFPERRPFFLEGADIFRTFGRNGANNAMGFNRSNPQLFYSRRIGRRPQGEPDGEFVDTPSATTILGAGKLAGKVSGGWSFNLLEAVTAREYADVADGPARSRVEVEPLTNYLAARVRRDLGQRAGVGLITTAVHRELSDEDLAEDLAAQAYLSGVDGHLFLDTRRDWVVTGGLSFSHLAGSEDAILARQESSARYYQRPDATHLHLDPTAESMSGWNLQVDLNRNSGTFRPNASVWAVSPGFEVNDLGYQTSADRRGTHAAFSWRDPTVDRFSRYRQLTVAKWYTWNGAGERLGDGVAAFGNATFPNYWSAWANVSFSREAYSDRLLRGGPMMRSPGFRSVNLDVQSDERKVVEVDLGGRYEFDTAGGWEAGGGLGITLKPAPAISLRVGPHLSREFDVAQYVTTVSDPTATAMYGSRYVFGQLDQTEISMATRLNVVMSPRMSLQMYVQPLLSVGDYTFLQEAAAPRTYEFLRYGLDTGSIAYDDQRQVYEIDPDGPGSAAPFEVSDPDFNFKSLRVNAVFRWEFRPGSTAYVVWTQQRQHEGSAGAMDIPSDFSQLMKEPSDNVLMLKVSYWLAR
jgi:hypothetical protein